MNEIQRRLTQALQDLVNLCDCLEYDGNTDHSGQAAYSNAVKLLDEVER